MCICTTVSADDNATIILMGGGEHLPIAYLGEYVDLSLVVGWSYRVAYWNSGSDPSLQQPDIIIDASGYQHHFYLDPSKFKVGTWYRWDGKWESSANMGAFEIKSGSRPAPTPIPTITGNITPLPTAVPEYFIHNKLLIARGDHVRYDYYYPDTATTAGYIWLFGTEQSVYGGKMNKDRNTTLYTYTFSEAQTQTFQPGLYTGYLQFVGKRQDVFYNATGNTLESPYAAIKPINLNGLNPERVRVAFETLENNKQYTDDKLVAISMEVKDPQISINEYYEDSGHIFVRGTSTAADGTNVSFVIDPAKYGNTPALAANTFTTKLVGTIESPREFVYTIPIYWNEMSIGVHKLVVKIETTGMTASQEKDFEVGLAKKSVPSQTIVGEKVIIGSGGWQLVTNDNGTIFVKFPNGTVYPVPTPTPKTVYVTQATPTPQVVYVNATPVVTQKLPAPVQTPSDDVVIPLPIEIVVLSVICGAYLVSRRK